MQLPIGKAGRPSAIDELGKAMGDAYERSAAQHLHSEGEAVAAGVTTLSGRNRRSQRLVYGAPGQIRTADTRFRRAVLYPLSYGRVSLIRVPDVRTGQG